MTDAEIERIYTDAKGESHAVALRAVYEAGRGHDAREAAEEAPKDDAATEIRQGFYRPDTEDEPKPRRGKA